MISRALEVRIVTSFAILLQRFYTFIVINRNGWQAWMKLALFTLVELVTEKAEHNLVEITAI